ncbi:MAG TPA: signal peptidase I [Candidatus Baltobacteraceae bacterium]|jgi:signal peptidase I|nr:signal peptidase I [Candidatus Baltobacteraceae bacterium]
MRGVFGERIGVPLTFSNFVKHGASILSQVALLALIAVAFTLRTPQVTGVSMEPLIAPGEIVLIDVLTYRLWRPHRGDIIAFHHDDGVPRLYVKRIIGLPGDRITIRDGVIFRNAERVQEGYVRYRDHRSAPSITVPPNSYYVLGDNRSSSEDSRDWGFVDQSRIVGRALVALWPPGRIETL